MSELRQDLPPDETSAMALLISGADALVPTEASECLDANDLAALADSSILPGARAAAEAHLSRCPGCRGLAAALLGARSGKGETADVPASASPAPAAQGSQPRRFGPYLLHRRLGGGGMGDVFEAEHFQRGRREALKQLRSGLEDDPRSAERFLREIRALSAVAHEHAVPLLDSGVVDGTAYYTMPLLPGPSFDQLLREVAGQEGKAGSAGANSVLDRHGIAAVATPSGEPGTNYARRIASALSGVARALAALHAAGMVHRDVKPSNLLLDAQRRAAITDFGLVGIEESRLTQSNEAVGTPAYMAPEQLVPGSPLDGRTDVYGLGVTLFELLTCRQPFEGRSVEETISRILSGRTPRLADVAPWLPREFGVVLGRCMEKQPEDRYPDMASLARDLDALSRGEEIAARPVPRLARLGRAVARRRVPLGVAAGLLAVVTALLLLLPGEIAIRSVPSAAVFCNGREIGQTPLEALRLPSGEHRIEIRRDGFVAVSKIVRIGWLRPEVLDVGRLEVVDPSDPKAYAAVVEAFGLQVATVKLDPSRSQQDVPAVVALLPRGLLREVPGEVRLWSDDVAENIRVRLLDGEGAIAEWTPDAFLKERRLEIPAGARGRLRPGGEYSIEVADAKGKGISSAAFRIASATEAAPLAEGLTSLRARLGKSDEMSEMVAAEYLLGVGLCSEALELVREIEARSGPRPALARMGLVALERTGLRDAAFWVDWADALADDGR